MSQSTSSTTGASRVTGSSLVADARSGALASTQGATTIADQVVSKIAGIATREVSGVYAVGGGAARAIGALRERIPGATTNRTQGISVEVGETQAAVDVDLVAEYGVAIADLASAVRSNVISSVERMTGLQVTEVNVAVNDIHLPEDDASDSDTATVARQTRVQ